MNKILRPYSREEWLKERESGIGSSEVGTILGVNPFETPYQLWRRKRGLDEPKQETFAMKAGHYLEDAVSKFYADATGKEIIKSSSSDWIIVNSEKDFLRVSPDRTFWLPGLPKSQSNKGILECKTTQREVDPDNLPSHWVCQLQYQLGVAEFEQGALAWLTAGRDFGYVDMFFDKEFFDYMCEEVQKFWDVNIIGGEEPMLTSVDDVLTKYPRHEDGKSVDADDTLRQTYEELKKVKEEISVLDVKKKDLENMLKMSMADAESIKDGKTVLATWKTGKDGKKFDDKTFAKEHPDLYEKYQVETKGIRRFLLK